jgi:hypothetical protein
MEAVISRREGVFSNPRIIPGLDAIFQGRRMGAANTGDES